MGPRLFRVKFRSDGSRVEGVDCSTQIPILEVSEQDLFYQKNFYYYFPPDKQLITISNRLSERKNI